MSDQLAYMWFLFAFTFLYLYNHSENMKDKHPWQLFHFLHGSRFPLFLLIPKILNMIFHPDHEYQCHINLHVWQFHLPSPLYVSIHIVTQGKEISITTILLLAWHRTSFLPPHTQNLNLWLLHTPEIPVSNQLARIIFSVAITSLYQYNNSEAMKEE